MVGVHAQVVVASGDGPEIAGRLRSAVLDEGEFTGRAGALAFPVPVGELRVVALGAAGPGEAVAVGSGVGGEAFGHGGGW